MYRLLVALLLLPGTPWAASEWTRFRGPNGTGVSEDRNLPAELGPSKNLLWKGAAPKGHSSPIVVGTRILFTGHDGDNRLLVCHDAATGALLWKATVPKLRSEAANPLNGPSTPTPATDGKSVFVFFPEVGLLSFDMTGREQWRVVLGPFGGIQGMAVSPLYADGKVLLLLDTPEEAVIQAFEAKTGKVAWKTTRPIGFLGSYSTPALYQPKGGPLQVIVAGAVELTSYQVRTGERLWWATGITNGPAAPAVVMGDSVYTVEPASGGGAPPFSQMLTSFDKNKNGRIELEEVSGEGTQEKIMYRLFGSIDRNVGNNDKVLTEEEFNKSFNPDKASGGLVRTRLGGKGDVSESHVVWRHNKGLPYVTAPVLYNGVLYSIRNGGILSTFDPETGKLLREERVKDAIGDYYASPVAADGKIYIVNKDGKVTVLKAGEPWEVIASADLGDGVIATPAIASSRIYVRTETSLLCFGLQ